MADLFKSAVSYLSGSPHDFENEFVGKTVVLGRYELKVKKVLGGGETQDDENTRVILWCYICGLKVDLLMFTSRKTRQVARIML